MHRKRLVVVHSVGIWLPQTMTWAHIQVCHLPPEVESHIVCENTENLEQFDVPHIHSLAQAPRWRYLWDKGLRRLKIRRHLGFLVEVAKQYQAQVLHSHFGNSGWANLAAARKANLKHVVTFYGLDVTYLPRSQSYWLERYQTLFAQVDCVLCEGPFMAQSIVALGCPEHKVRVHHLGVNVDEIPFKPRVWRATEPLRVLIAASFREKKGIPYALEALGRFQREVPLEITLIGDAGQETRSQAEKQKIMATFTKHHLLSKTRLLGYQPYTVLLEEAYKHHVFLSPSVTASDGDTEGGAPVSLIDMMASGIPIVSTTHCDIPEVVQDGITGLLAEERDVDGLVDHLKWLVDHPDRWQSMLEAGRTYVEREYNARVQGERLGVIYSQLCRNRYE